MKIDFSRKILDPDNKEIPRIQGGKEPLTIGVVCLMALLNSESKDGNEKFARYELAMRIKQAKDNILDISIDDIAKVKKLIGEVYGSLIVGRAFDILEQKKRNVD